MDIPVPDDCPEGGEFVSARVNLNGTGENFFGGRAQERLEESAGRAIGHRRGPQGFLLSARSSRCVCEGAERRR